MEMVCNLFAAAMNRHRKRLFGDCSLKLHGTTPEAGETFLKEFTEDWFGQRVDSTTDTGAQESGAWQFQIRAKSTWEFMEQLMLRATVITIGNRRWMINKVEKPIGNSLVWKIRAEIQ